MPFTAEWRSFGEFDVVLALDERGAVREAITATPAILHEFLTGMDGLRSWRGDLPVEGERRAPEPWGALVMARAAPHPASVGREQGKRARNRVHGRDARRRGRHRRARDAQPPVIGARSFYDVDLTMRPSNRALREWEARSSTRIGVSRLAS